MNSKRLMIGATYLISYPQYDETPVEPQEVVVVAKTQEGYLLRYPEGFESLFRWTLFEDHTLTFRKGPQ